MAKKHVVIVGGGFGGVKAALLLVDSGYFKITLVTDHADFRYYPSLYRTATGGRRTSASIPLSQIFAGKAIDIVQDSAVKLDRTARTLTTKDKQTVNFNVLVLALGVRTNYFGIKGLPEFSYGIKTYNDAMELKQHLHQQLIDEHKPDLNYVVIGGGPTGVELAGVLPAYIKSIAKKHGIKRRAINVNLVEAAPRLVPRLPKDMSRRIARHLRHIGVKLHLGTVVKAETADALMLGDKELKSQTVIWTAGIANQPFFADNVFQMTKTGKVRVNQYLEAEPGIFVIGDNADTPYSGMAQTALYDGVFIAQNLIKQAKTEETVPYKAKRPVYVIPAGANWSAVLWGKVRVYGRLGAALRSLADLVAYHDYEPWKIASKRWLAQDDTQEECPTCGNK